MNKQQDRDSGLVLVVESVGGFRQLAKLLGGKVSYQAISKWRRIPAYWLVDVEKATGIPRHDIWPALYEGYSPDSHRTATTKSRAKSRPAR
jgi:DNA-binding transcriptional regulator YdaS (Cro superfamily)